jgi:hypothetical protein
MRMAVYQQKLAATQRLLRSTNRAAAVMKTRYVEVRHRELQPRRSLCTSVSAKLGEPEHHAKDAQRRVSVGSRCGTVVEEG